MPNGTIHNSPRHQDLRLTLKIQITGPTVHFRVYIEPLFHNEFLCTTSQMSDLHENEQVEEQLYMNDFALILTQRKRQLGKL